MADVDLVHAQLQNADLEGAKLQRANLSQARLDGANLQGTDLSFTNLQGASLRGANLQGSRLIGTDLRNVNLTGALLDQHALDKSHWDGALGVSKGARSHASLHNAGVDAAQARRWTEAEKTFSAAIKANPEEPLSWVARGLSRGEQGKNNLASLDLAHAGKLFGEQGDTIKADQLKEASLRVYALQNQPSNPGGSGLGSALLSGLLTTVQSVAPIVLKALMPITP